jgi:hypothetical protein
LLLTCPFSYFTTGGLLPIILSWLAVKKFPHFYNPILLMGVGLTTPHRKKLSCYENSQEASGMD